MMITVCFQMTITVCFQMMITVCFQMTMTMLEQAENTIEGREEAIPADLAWGSDSLMELLHTYIYYLI